MKTVTMVPVIVKVVYGAVLSRSRKGCQDRAEPGIFQYLLDNRAFLGGGGGDS